MHVSFPFHSYWWMYLGCIQAWGTYKGWCEGRGCPVWSAGACDPMSPSETADWGSDGGPCSIFYLQQQQRKQKRGGLMLHVSVAQGGLAPDQWDFPHVPHKQINTEFPLVWLKAVQAHEDVTQAGCGTYIKHHWIPENPSHLFKSLFP